MKIAFVGVKRKYQELDSSYRDFFNRYHLELPFYYARDGKNWVTITTVDYNGEPLTFGETGALQCISEGFFKSYLMNFGYEVVVHWRKWFPELYVPGAINVINCQDHSFSQEWKKSAESAFKEGKLYGVMCFPAWHKENLLTECPWLPKDRAIAGITLGVDTDIYFPDKEKNPKEMLWASDPGRGLNGALQLALMLHQRDHDFRLNVCWPDYCKPPQMFKHPAIIWRGNVGNGPDLWSLFNKTGILPYTSTFKEPSSRAHRQAMAAGSMVLYPPGMGTPSDLIISDGNGIVAPVDMWVDTILDYVKSGRWRELGERARNYAVAENWSVQAKMFNSVFSEILRSQK